MWFGKNIMTKLGLVLAMAVPALAAEEEDAFPLDPLYFPGATEDDAQEIWSELMKYKLWATSGFDVGNRLEVKEDKGWVGTSDGDFVMTGPGAQVGGPIIIGGNVDLQNKGAGFLTGPLRVEKTLTLNTESEFYGTVCIQGDTVVPTRDDWNAEFINGVYQNVHGEMIIGSTEATTGACANDKVAFVEKKMTVPSLKSVTYNGNLVATGNHQIDVPNEEGPYDLYYESVTISNDSKLHINMPKGGRLTRIFTKSITFGNQAELQVMYDGTLLSNQEYEGMFMIYVSGDIVFDNTNDKILQGTFISSGTITTKCNMKFAGQMIANKIVIGNEIKGDDAFRYVPVVPPVIDIKPTASAMGGFIENNTTVEIPITLSTATKNGVSFKYCFDLSKSTAELADFNVYPNEDKDGNEYPAFPVCGSCGSNCGTVDIPRNAKEPDKKVYLNVKLDDDGEEPTEKLAMKIYDLNGAVLPKNSNGLFDLNILNVPLFNFGDVDENYYINEHAIAPNDTVAKIPIEGQDFTDFVISMVDNASDTHPVKLNDLFNISIDETKKLVVITVKNHDELNYESDRIKKKYQVTLNLKDKGGVEGCKTVTAQTTINIEDINEPPYFVNFGPYEVKEHSPKGTSVGFVLAEDPDDDPAYNTLVYTIPVNEDNDKTNDVPFAINPSTGEITVAEPNKEKFDYETHPLPYVFNVEVFDNLNRVPKEIEISLIDINEPPIVIDTTHDTISVAENSPVGVTKMAYFEVSDPDADDNANLLTQIKPTITDNKKKNGVVSAEDLFEMVMEKAKDEYGVDKYWAVLKVKADLDFEAIMAARGDSVFEVTLTFTDQAGAGLDTSLAKKIAVTDMNEEPYFTAAGPFDVKENSPVGTPIGEVKAADDDIKEEYNTLYYTIPVNEDSDPDNDVPFAIVNIKSGLITVANKEALDFEDPNILEHKFEFKVQVTDGEFVKDTLVTITLVDDDEPPKIIPVCEGGNCVEICKGDKCEVCVGETCDEHEICTDNCDNPRGDDPAKTLTVAVKEHSQTGHKIISYAVRDEDYGVGHTTALTAEIRNTNGSGADTLFEAKMVKDINGNWNVVVSVIDSAKLDYEKINETHNVTIYVYDPEDSDGMYDSLLRVIKVVDVNEAPKAEDADFKPEENLPDSAVVGELMVVEPDIKHIKEFGHLEYSIIGKDETFVFAMDSNRVIVNDPSMMDYELPVHFYTFDVLIANCELNKTSGKYDVACLYDTAKVTVDIQDVNEKPTIIVDGPIPDGDDDSDSLCVAHCDTTDRGVWKDSILTIGVKENTEDSLLSKTDMVIFQYHVVDPDTGHAMGAKVEWIDFGSSISSSTVKGPDLFDISYDPTTQTIKATVKDEKLLDYEELRKATSREDPDPEYKVGILVTDPNGLKDTLIRVIRIIDVNEKPLYTAEPCVVVEGNHPGDSIGHVEHPSDIDSLSRNPALYDNQFKITGGDFDRFELRKDSTDLMRVMLVALDSIDCENGSYVCGVDSVYWVELTYGDTTLKTVYNNIRIPVKVLDLNEPPEFRTDTIGVAENSPMGTVVDTIKWFDWDRFDTTMHFEISSDPSGCFAIDKNTGIVTVKKDRCAVLDHEKNPTLKIEVAITDMVDVTDRSLISGGPNTVKKIITVNVRDVNEPPTIIEETFSVDEDAKKGSVVDTVKATDPDKDPKFNKLIFTAIGGDTATFKIDSITGIVTLKDTLDYETKSKYELVVRVYDGEYADTAIVPIYVNNKIEKTEVKITLYDDSTKVWRDPDTVFTNSPGREICWVQGRSDRDLKDTCMDVHITKDSVIVIRYKDPTTDSYGVDSLFIFYSNATPIVTISGDQEANLANNFYTIVEDTDKGDTNLYVNERKKDVRVTVKDPANKKDTSFVVKLNLQTVNVPQKTLDAVNKIVNENRFVLNENPKGGVTRTPVNGNEVKYSYREVFGKDTVTVSYMTDNDGNPVLVPVLNDKGKVDSIEVMTVSYNVVIDGKTVTISFVVNAATGEVLVKDSNGTLMESGASKVASSSSSKGDATSSSSSNKSSVTEGMFLITYSVKDPLGNSTTVSYSVDEKGKMVQNADGDTGYAVAYTYTNKYGNSATQSLFIVLDQKGPTVEILKPLKGQVIRSNYVEVVWTVNGEIQDTLTVQGLDKGPNYIKRFYRDKAGNEAADTVLVIMKDSKDVEIAVVTPVTEMNPDEVKEYYEENPPEEGETFAVSILNPTSGKEVETLKGGSFKTKKGSGEELYPGKEKKHLGPTLALDVKLPTIKDGEGNTGLGGLATLDDLVLPNGKISNIGIGIDTSKLSDELKREYKEYTVEEYVEKFCEDGTSVPSDLSKFNMYKTKMQVNIWVYTSLGNFVDYFSFGQEMNDPEYTNDAGKLKMFFEMKPDKDGFVKADNGKLYATGAYLYKVEATIRSTLRCTILDEAVLHDKPNAKRKGDKIKSDDELLKPFGYKRPKTK